jgi:hypothetical protein
MRSPRNGATFHARRVHPIKTAKTPLRHPQRDTARQSETCWLMHGLTPFKSTFRTYLLISNAPPASVTA